MKKTYENILETAGSGLKSSFFTNVYKNKLEEDIEQFFREFEENKENFSKTDFFTYITSVSSEILYTGDASRFAKSLGRLLSEAVGIERSDSRSEGVMKRLMYPFKHYPESGILVINPGSTSTKVAWFKGTKKLYESDVHLSPDAEDNTKTRTASILNWMHEKGLKLSEIDGIACRGGFMKPVPSGTYKISSEMLSDLSHPRIEHASNMSIMIGKHIAELSERESKILITTSDPVVCDEIDTVERMTGFIKIKMDGTGAHYLNHKAVLKFVASVTGKKTEDVHCITAHIGGGSSIARHNNGKVTSLIDAFSGIPSANRSGRLDMPRILAGLENDEITFKELKSITFSKGGLLSLAGTNDFRALAGFIKQGASQKQTEKIQLIFEFYARQIAQAVMKLSCDGNPVHFVAVTGGLAYSTEIANRLKVLIGERFPLIFVPGSLEHESLAANLLKAQVAPEILKDYAIERDKLAEKRKLENRILDTVIFERPLLFRKHGSPIKNMDELIDSAIIKVQENYVPTIGIIGADNEEALLAAKRANKEGSYKLAKFKLIGDFVSINKIAYDYDLIIDDDNFTIIDSEDPISEAIKLFAEGKIDILMKGSLHTDEILRGIFKYLKSSGKLQKGELISHSVVMDIPTRNKLTIISDAAVNPYPDKEKKIKIINNAIRVAKLFNIKKPKTAIISAVENINKSVASSVEADEIAKVFKDRKDCIVEGPLSFDVAMNTKIAIEKKYKGVIKGTADILIMPDIDAGNILYKTLTTQSGAVCAGIILAGNIPIILTSRGDSARSKQASISLGISAYFNLKK